MVLQSWVFFVFDLSCHWQDFLILDTAILSVLCFLFKLQLTEFPDPGHCNLECSLFFLFKMQLTGSPDPGHCNLECSLFLIWAAIDIGYCKNVLCYWLELSFLGFPEPGYCKNVLCYWFELSFASLIMVLQSWVFFVFDLSCHWQDFLILDTAILSVLCFFI